MLTSWHLLFVIVVSLALAKRIHWLVAIMALNEFLVVVGTGTRNLLLNFEA